MKGFITFGLLSLFNVLSISEEVYKALGSNKEDDIDNVMSKIEVLSSTTPLEAYKGVLLMRKADFATTPKKKLDTFKLGHKLLEEAIVIEPNNVEFRFLRLMIQENAPKVLKYNSQTIEDGNLVKEHFKVLDSKLQGQIVAYAQQSTVLKPSDFLNK